MASCGIVSSVSPAHPPRPPVPFCSPATPSCISCQSDGSAQFPSFSAQPTSPHLSACFQTAGLPRQEEGEVPGHCSSLRARCSSLAHLLSLSELRREQSLPLSISSLPLPSSLPAFLPSPLAFLCFSSPHPSSLFPLSPCLSFSLSWT